MIGEGGGGGQLGANLHPRKFMFSIVGVSGTTVVFGICSSCARSTSKGWTLKYFLE